MNTCSARPMCAQVTHPTISPWRRAVAGDLTTAFNFDGPPDYSVGQGERFGGTIATTHEDALHVSPSPPAVAGAARHERLPGAGERPGKSRGHVIALVLTY